MKLPWVPYEVTARRLPAARPTSEHPIADEPRGVARPLVAWLLALGPVLIGALVSVQKETIVAGTKRFADLLFGATTRAEVDLAPMPIVFWALCLAWASFLAVRLQRVDTLSRDRRLSLIRAVHHVPNLNVIKNYPTFYRKVARTLRKEPRGDAEALAKPIRKTLKRLATMAQEFSRATKATYSANIMLTLDPESVRPEHTAVLRFNGDTRLDALLAVLHLPNGLRSTPDSGIPHYEPVIALPVSQEEYDGRKRRRVIPGAPWTMKTGTPGTYEDTHAIGKYCTDFAQPVQDEIVEYFTAGEGKTYRSFASFRLNANGNPVAVLNIDSNDVNVLGGSREYYVTFYALIEPVLHLLVPHVTAFAAAAYTESEVAQALKAEAAAADSAEEPSAPLSGPSGSP